MVFRGLPGLFLWNLFVEWVFLGGQPWVLIPCHQDPLWSMEAPKRPRHCCGWWLVVGGWCINVLQRGSFQYGFNTGVRFFFCGGWVWPEHVWAQKLMCRWWCLLLLFLKGFPEFNTHFPESVFNKYPNIVNPYCFPAISTPGSFNNISWKETNLDPRKSSGGNRHHLLQRSHLSCWDCPSLFDVGFCCSCLKFGGSTRKRSGIMVLFQKTQVWGKTFLAKRHRWRPGSFECSS